MNVYEDTDDEKDYNSEAGWYDDVDPTSYSFNDDYDPNAADAGVKNSTWDKSAALLFFLVGVPTQIKIISELETAFLRSVVKINLFSL